LPKAIIREHWREKRRMENRTNDTPEFENVSWLALLAAAVPFLAIAFLSLMNLFQWGGANAPDWSAFVFLGIIVLPFLIGLFKGVPRWCLPYFGLVASVASLMLSLFLNRALWRSPSVSAPWFVQVIIPNGIWVGLVLLSVFFVILTLVLPPLRPVYARIRQDWTLVSFGLYGAMVITLILTFEDYTPGKWLFIILSASILVIGEMAYLRSTQVRQRGIVLFISVTLAMAIAIVGKAYLATIPNWPFPGIPDWQNETFSTIINAAWAIIVVIGLPALINFLPRPSQPAIMGHPI
jgi:hypothetical protein